MMVVPLKWFVPRTSRLHVRMVSVLGILCSVGFSHLVLMNYPTGVKIGPVLRMSRLVMRSRFVPTVNQFFVLQVSVLSTPSNAHP